MSAASGEGDRLTATEGDPSLVRSDLVAGTETGVTPFTIGDRVHLAAASCPRCAHVEFPGLEHCPTCGALAEPTRLAVDAELAGFTAVLHAPPGALVEVPYHVGVARFPEGICVMGLLLGVSDEEEPTLGEPVETVLAQPYEGALTYAFRL